MNEAQLPPGHEILPESFLREHGAQPDMIFFADGKWRKSSVKVGTSMKELSNLHPYAAKIGTIAAATTPLPEGKCDCAYSLYYPAYPKHLPSCSIHRRYIKKLPHELAALPEKPEGLIYSVRENDPGDWNECYLAWPFEIDPKMDSVTAYAIPDPSVPAQGEEWKPVTEATGPLREAMEMFGMTEFKNVPELSTQPETEVKSCATSIQTLPKSSTPKSEKNTNVAVASNAASANVPTVALGGNPSPVAPSGGEKECPICHGKRGDCPFCNATPPPAEAPTPRTDAEWKRLKDAEKPFPVSGAFAADAWADIARNVRNFARTLERELSAMRQERDRVQRILDTANKDWADDDTAIKALCAKHGVETELTGPGAYFKSVVECVEELSGVLATVTAERDEALKKQPINTSLRLFDLVRFMRSELHEQGLVTDEEYAWLCYGSDMAVSKKGGSPSRERLEDYDVLAAQLASLKAELAAMQEERDALKPKTMRQIHEEAAGMGLDPMFFALNHINPDHTEVEHLRASAESARKDGERLDWLEAVTAYSSAHRYGYIMVPSGKPCEVVNLRICVKGAKDSSLRSAIDAARLTSEGGR